MRIKMINKAIENIRTSMSYLALGGMVIMVFLSPLTAHATNCLKRGDLVTGTLVQSTQSHHTMPDFEIQSLLLDSPRCLMITEKKSLTTPQDEVQIISFNNLKRGVFRYYENIARMRITNIDEPSSPFHKLETVLDVEIVSILAKAKNCSGPSYPNQSIEFQEAATRTLTVKNSGRTNFFSHPSESCRSNIFIVKGDSFTALTESNGFTFIKYTSKDRIDFYGWVQKSSYQ
jgi:hypothetical protein